MRLDELGYWMGQLGMAGTSQGYQVDAVLARMTSTRSAIFCGVNPTDFVATPDPAAPFALGLEAFNLLEGGDVRPGPDHDVVAGDPDSDTRPGPRWRGRQL